MAQKPNDERELRAVADAYAMHDTKAAAADSLGLPRSTFDARFRRAFEAGYVTEKADEPKARLTIEEKKDQSVVTSIAHDVKTMEDALRKAEIDRNVWEVDRCIINAYEVAMKIGPEKQVHKEPLWQVKVWLRRIAPKHITDGLDCLMDRFKALKPKYPKPQRKKLTDPHLLEVSLFDAHFGKLAWARETGTDYDLKIAERLYLDAVDSLLLKAKHYPIERVVFPVGQDFFNANNTQGTTARGTPQDMDSRLAKVFEVGTLAVQKAIDRCAQMADVDVLYVPGNHDPETSFYMAWVLWALYEGTNAPVRVDRSPMTRKFIEYGSSLIGFSHGDEEKHNDLVGIMASAQKEAWARTTHHEWHIGHFHKKKEIRTVDADTHSGGVVIRVLPSLSGTDAWHYRKGYISNRAAEAYLWSKANGYAGHFSVSVDELEAQP